MLRYHGSWIPARLEKRLPRPLLPLITPQRVGAHGFAAHGRTEHVQRPSMRVSGPTFDAADPIALAEFYERLLGWPIVRREGPRPGNPPQDGWALLRAPFGDGKLEVQWEPFYVPPVWPPAEGAQLMMVHLDIGVADLDRAVGWAVAQGARLADHQPQAGVRVMLDPEGHPFCLFTDDTLGEDDTPGTDDTPGEDDTTPP